MWRKYMDNILSTSEISDMRICGKFLARAISQASQHAKPGISTFELNRIAEEKLLELGARPSFKNYYVAGIGNYPASLCVSINDEIVHGIPNKSRVLKDGDIVSLDLGAEYNGIYSDMALTVPVGKISDEARRLIDLTRLSLDTAILQISSGKHIGDIGSTIEEIAQRGGLGIVRDYVGHGIGRKPHLPPQIPNYAAHEKGPKIQEGMALAIEPMLTLGAEETKIKPDGWTVVTADRSLAAHFEHTVVIVDGIGEIVTVC